MNAVPLPPPPVPDDQPAIRAARLRHNASRLQRLAPALAGVHAVHVAWFGLVGAGDGSPLSEAWRMQIAASHLFLAVLAVAVALGCRTERARRDGWPWPLLMTTYLVSGAVIAGIDQQVTPAITPYVVVCFGLPIVIRLRAGEAVAAYVLGYAAFVVAMLAVPHAPDQRASLWVNGMTTAGMGLAMELVFTRAFQEAEQARLTIQRQTGELESLRGLLSVCAYCRKIRNEDQQWEPLDHYIARHSEARFSHGICTECYARMDRHLPPED